MSDCHVMRHAADVMAETLNEGDPQGVSEAARRFRGACDSILGVAQDAEPTSEEKRLLCEAAATFEDLMVGFFDRAGRDLLTGPHGSVDMAKLVGWKAAYDEVWVIDPALDSLSAVFPWLGAARQRRR